MPHVLLIRPLCEGDEPEFAEPLGIERLAGYLRAAGAADVTVLDRRLYQQERRAGLARSRFWDDVREACAEREPSVVGLSLMTSADVPDALRIISRMRSLYPAARLVAGGLYVTTDPTGCAGTRPPRGHTSFRRGRALPPRVCDEGAQAHRAPHARRLGAGIPARPRALRGSGMRRQHADLTRMSRSLHLLRDTPACPSCAGGGSREPVSRRG